MPSNNLSNIKRKVLGKAKNQSRGRWLRSQNVPTSLWQFNICSMNHAQLLKFEDTTAHWQISASKNIVGSWHSASNPQPILREFLKRSKAYLPPPPNFFVPQVAWLTTDWMQPSENSTRRWPASTPFSGRAFPPRAPWVTGRSLRSAFHNFISFWV